MGTPEFAVPCLSALSGEGHIIEMVVTQPDRPSGRHRRLKPPPVKEYALAHDLPIIQPASLRDTGVVNLLGELDPDVIVVAAFGEVLRSDLLGLPRYGALNVHASLLPKYRGASPVSAAILAGEQESGVTIMLMDQGLDTGDILAQERVAIQPRETQESLTGRLSDLGARLLVRTLPAWISGEISALHQDASMASYAGLVTKEAGKIDWKASAGEIERKVRAYVPWPLAHTTWNNRQLSILAAAAVGHGVEGAAGQVIGLQSVRVPGEGGPSELVGLVIAAGSGALAAARLQLAGGKPMSAEEFVRGHPAIVGTLLGASSA